MKKRKSISIILGICVLIGVIGCGCSKPNERSIVVSEPYSMVLYFEKKHSGHMAEKILFEADTKRQFDRLVNKYEIHYDQNDCIYEFDKEFFRNNKVYIIHKNYYDNPVDRKYRIKRNNDNMIVTQKANKKCNILNYLNLENLCKKTPKH